MMSSLPLRRVVVSTHTTQYNPFSLMCTEEPFVRFGTSPSTCITPTNWAPSSDGAQNFVTCLMGLTLEVEDGWLLLTFTLKAFNRCVEILLVYLDAYEVETEPMGCDTT